MVHINVKNVLVFCIWVFMALLPVVVHSQAGAPVRIDFEGISGRELENVKIAVTVPEGLVRNGVVDEKWMEHFKKQIPDKAKEALQPFGYYNADVTVSSDVADNGMYQLHVFIEPGEPVRVTEVMVAVKGPGSTERRLADLVRTFPVHKGVRLQQDVYERAKDALRSKAVELGYLGAEFSEHEIRVDPERSTAEIQLVLQTGELYYFGDITFSGAPHYAPNFLGRFIEFKPGEIFSHQKIGESQKNLTHADRFRSVMIYADKEQAADHVIPVDIQLEESKPKRLRMGVGYETDIGPKGTFKYEDVNFRQTSHRFEAQFDFSAPLMDAGVRYVVPHPKDIRSFSTLRFNAKREDYRDAPDYFGNTIPDYYAETLTAEYERARSFGKAGTGAVFLQLLKENSDVGDDHTNTFSVMPGFRLSAINYDNMVRPQTGHRYLVELKGTHQAIGSSTGFVQLIGDGGIIIPLPARFALLTRAKVGLTAQNEADTDLPVPLRFFAGGDKSVRGYKYKSLGPTDADGNVIGGKNTFVGSVELEKAIGKDWGIAIFYDVGNAFNDLNEITLAQGAGIGGRYYSPIGPIKLDIARQIDQPRPDIRIHISIGFGL